jgi:hypothetical protein
MTPQEQAKEVIRKYYSVGAIECEKCALIAVDLICELLEDNGLTFTEYHDRTTIEYWLQVKEEIKKL